MYKGALSRKPKALGIHSLNDSLFNDLSNPIPLNLQPATLNLTPHTYTGRLKQKVEPFPGSLSTVNSPPCASMMFLAMDSPKPTEFSRFC